MRQLIPFALASLALTAAACDGQTGPDYNGEKLATVHGTIVNERTSDVPAAEVDLVWAVTSGPEDFAVATKAPVRGDFPAAFQLDVFEPPPDEALNDFTNGGANPDETRIGVALVIVGEAGKDLITDESAVLGGAEQHVLVYVEDDVQAGTESAEFLHGTPSAGYHLMEVVDEGGTFDQLYEAPDGLDTEIEARLVDDLEDFRVPNWT